MNISSKFVDIEYISNLIFQVSSMCVFYLDTNGDVVHKFTSGYVTNPFYSSRKEQLSELYQKDDPHDFPIFRSSNYQENFISICVKEEDNPQGTIIIGPSIYSELSEERIDGVMNDFDLFRNKKEEITHYYQSLPIINKEKLMNIGILIYYTLYNKKLDINHIRKKNSQLENTSTQVKNIDLIISKRLQNITSRQDPKMVNKLLQNVKEGRKEEVIKYLESLPPEKFGVLSKTSHIRSQKNLLIAGITLATRAAVEGGLHPEVAYTLSDLYIQKLETLNNIKAIERLRDEAFCSFVERVYKVKDQKYSKSITFCQHYIFNHLYEKITLSLLSNLVDMNPSYLSVLFKKEVGISLSEYIQQAKIEEARNLLTLTNYSLSDICSLLHFNDQSYFTKIFKKFTGVTPKHFRNKHTVS
ncbi:helix-turn-helix domain-containing protein [Bacillus sp. CH30_1T]|uniref:helix-turn-helix domain-containing protein n=1 Tax=Bacillus sp. CH30_1T TaxID=2604836 RepID=UPI0011F04F8E|nr:helix-turn-helix domain-containing protein [Bacillus sp. CH30_1T]KAA0562246.1 helix-turn-helix domain-containing protein [Bacillus sp. CH30_1T]